MDINEVSYGIRGCVFNVYNAFGPGLLESVYEEALIYELTKEGFKVEAQKEVPIMYCGTLLRSTLRLDLLVNDAVILELKSVEELKPIHYKQLQTYLKLSNHKLGLLINFNTNNISKDIHRVIM
mgnify:CR=1 FL=1